MFLALWLILDLCGSCAPDDKQPRALAGPKAALVRQGTRGRVRAWTSASFRPRSPRRLILVDGLMPDGKTALYLLLFLIAACSSGAGVSGESSTSPLDNDLTGVACPNVSLCFAVGQTFISGASGEEGYRTLIERWDGRSWSVVKSPDSGDGQSHIARLSCASSSLCFAVGYDGPYLHTHVLIERWNGSSWSLVTAPSIGNSINSVLRDVSCPAASLCFAVGQYFPTGGDIQGLIERWSGGSWTVMPDMHLGFLYATGCKSVTFCLAAGVDYTFERGKEVTLNLTELWNGTAWKVVPTGPSEGQSPIDTVSCTDTVRCVGSAAAYGAEPGGGPMIETWDGSSWHVAQTPHPPVPAGPAQVVDRLQSVTCIGASFCLAVGWHIRNTTQRSNADTLAELWDGTGWKIVPSPNGTTTAGHDANNGLTAIACPDSSHCLAVGHYSPRGVFQTLAEQWNGTAWSIVPSANRSP
jgi:hypothetical protein